MQSRYNRRARQLPVLPLHQTVRVQHPGNLRCFRTGTVEAQPRPRQYVFRLTNGRTVKRNRVHLRLVPAAYNSDTTLQHNGAPAQDSPCLRRSECLQQRIGAS
ncbi:hypothetical protein Pcinc_005699 [Petrolisthes cinctipes]|uniref:Uncharacterized protein n=1 Tax=Petrolisthes cinctipes TaxID=88211 RepID=A0AAE1L0A4_PETCI|nr:hypothetical protein Pcinc_005699 [Petrolisthes cinctipes]